MNTPRPDTCTEDTYVVCPNPTYLPDCEDGWEVAPTGEATCAAPLPLREDLAATGGGLPAEVGVAGAVLLLLGVALVTARRWTRG